MGGADGTRDVHTGALAHGLSCLSPPPPAQLPPESLSLLQLRAEQVPAGRGLASSRGPTSLPSFPPSALRTQRARSQSSVP